MLKNLNEKLVEEDNGLKALGILNKILREKRDLKFGKWLKRLESIYIVENLYIGKYTIHTLEFGKLDYFPKANKLLIRNQNKWIKPGLQWVIKYLLEECYDTRAIRRIAR